MAVHFPFILTLTTDFGSLDAYVPAMKGVILGVCPNAVLVDVTHEIPPQDVTRAGLVLRDTVPWYPPNTVHVVVVDPGVGTQRRAVLLRCAGQWLVGPDNGVFAPLLESLQEPVLAWDISHSAHGLEPRSATFHGRDLFAPVGAHLMCGVSPDKLGVGIDPASLVPGLVSPCREVEAGLEGQVVLIDHFGNLVTNVSRQALAGRVVQSIVLGEHRVDRMVQTYGEVPLGHSPVALFGSSGYLEVAVRDGSAWKVLHVDVGAKVDVVCSGSGGVGGDGL